MSIFNSIKTAVSTLTEAYVNGVAQAKARTEMKRAFYIDLKLRMFPTRVGNIGAFIHVNDVEIAAMGFTTTPYACAWTLTSDGTVRTDVCDVIMNSKMDAAPKHVRDAVIAHECGHVFHMHDERKTGRQFQFETDADLYAQNNGYAMIAALE